MGKARTKIRDIEQLRSLVRLLPLKLEGAYLFGSRARGGHLEGSDWDVMLIAPDFAAMPFPQRGTYILENSALRRVDLLCYTPGEIKERAGEIGIVAEALLGISLL
jgi:predicted nucleotidyltransferase